MATWPEKAGAKIIGNDTGGRKEALGVWAWKLDALQPGEQVKIKYSLTGLERGDWTETEILFRGSQDVIGATKMDEKFLEEIRRQEKLQSEEAVIEEPSASGEIAQEAIPEPVVAAPEGQRTLFGGDA